jgi:hypothetical protein
MSMRLSGASQREVKKISAVNISLFDDIEHLGQKNSANLSIHHIRLFP